jgi:hypothetical protein
VNGGARGKTAAFEKAVYIACGYCAHTDWRVVLRLSAILLLLGF